MRLSIRYGPAIVYDQTMGKAGMATVFTSAPFFRTSAENIPSFNGVLAQGLRVRRGGGFFFPYHWIQWAEDLGHGSIT